MKNNLSIKHAVIGTLLLTTVGLVGCAKRSPSEKAAQDSIKKIGTLEKALKNNDCDIILSGVQVQSVICKDLDKKSLAKLFELKKTVVNWFAESDKLLNLKNSQFSEKQKNSLKQARPQMEAIERQIDDATDNEEANLSKSVSGAALIKIKTNIEESKELVDQVRNLNVTISKEQTMEIYARALKNISSDIVELKKQITNPKNLSEAEELYFSVDDKRKELSIVLNDFVEESVDKIEKVVDEIDINMPDNSNKAGFEALIKKTVAEHGTDQQQLKTELAKLKDKIGAENTEGTLLSVIAQFEKVDKAINIVVPIDEKTKTTILALKTEAIEALSMIDVNVASLNSEVEEEVVVIADKW